MRRLTDWQCRRPSGVSQVVGVEMDFDSDKPSYSVKESEMKRFALIFGVLAGLAIGTNNVHASWGSLGYSGWQPWYNIFAKRYKCLTPEEERLQKFWHDYYNAMEKYYGALDNIDWVAYYKNHGYQINSGPGGSSNGRVNYAPVFVSPGLQWAVPNGAVGGPPVSGGMPAGYGVMPAGGAMPAGGNFPPMPVNYAPGAGY